MSEPDYFLEINNIGDEPEVLVHSACAVGRPWVGIHFECCNVYNRVYRNAEGTAYMGCCPRCLKKVRLAVGPRGVASRFFTAE
jgi:hypothetical protein